MKKKTKLLLINSIAVAFFIFISDIGAMLTWCIGKWGQGDADLQYKYQCRCPPSTESLRYPETVDIIFSACDFHEVDLSPSGRMLLVDDNPYYVWDLKTDEKIQVAWPDDNPANVETGFVSFLTDDLLFDGRYRGPRLFDYRTGEQIPLQEIEEADLQIFRNAAQVYLLHVWGYAVALSHNYRDDQGENYFLNYRKASSIAEYLQQMEIPFQHYAIFNNIPDIESCRCLMSPDGRFSYRGDGIYLEETNQKIVDSISGFRAYGWIFDNSGVLLREQYVCLRRNFTGDVCERVLHQPVIKLNIPNEYLDVNLVLP